MLDLVLGAAGLLALVLVLAKGAEYIRDDLRDTDPYRRARGRR